MLCAKAEEYLGLNVIQRITTINFILSNTLAVGASKSTCKCMLLVQSGACPD